MPLEPELTCRVALGIVILCAVSIGIPFRVRADRAGGHVPTRVDPRWFWLLMMLAGPPLALTCLAFLAAPRTVDFAQLPLPAYVRLLGIPVSALGVALFAWMFQHLGLNVTSTSMPRTSAVLVTSGPYRWIRHPMYSAALILALGTSLLTANLIVMVSGVAMFLLLMARSRIEESRLVEKFGDAYREYQRRTGRFFPSL